MAVARPPYVGCPALPLPAMTESCPAGVIFSITLAPGSATYTAPAESTPMPPGSESAEAVAKPGVGWADVPEIPAMIERVPPGVTFAITLGPASAM